MVAQKKNAAPGMGPPRLSSDEPKRLNIVAPPAWVDKVHAWRRNQPDLPNLSEAIRRLVDAGLDVGKKGKKGK